MGIFDLSANVRDNTPMKNAKLIEILTYSYTDWQSNMAMGNPLQMETSLVKSLNSVGEIPALFDCRKAGDCN